MKLFVFVLLVGLASAETLSKKSHGLSKNEERGFFSDKFRDLLKKLEEMKDDLMEKFHGEESGSGSGDFPGRPHHGPRRGDFSGRPDLDEFSGLPDFENMSGEGPFGGKGPKGGKGPGGKGPKGGKGGKRPSRQMGDKPQRNGEGEGEGRPEFSGEKPQGGEGKRKPDGFGPKGGLQELVKVLRRIADDLERGPRRDGEGRDGEGKPPKKPEGERPETDGEPDSPAKRSFGKHKGKKGGKRPEMSGERPDHSGRPGDFSGRPERPEFSGRPNFGRRPQRPGKSLAVNNNVEDFALYLFQRISAILMRKKNLMLIESIDMLVEVTRTTPSDLFVAQKDVSWLCGCAAALTDPGRERGRLLVALKAFSGVSDL
ncbi:hypothetical protein CAPTEDRAFT_227151, partial [Capitella teleta]